MPKYPLSHNIAKLAKILLQNKWLCSSAESCTGGLLGAALTSVEGASSWYAGGFITYSNELKHDLLDVPMSIITEHGAVSGQCVKYMAIGACKATNTKLGIAISGVAGPDGGTVKKPVGTTWIGFAINDTASAELLQLKGTREEIRNQAVHIAIASVLKKINLGNAM